MLVDRLGVSERRACQIAGQHRSTQRREPCVAPDDAALRARLREISAERPAVGLPSRAPAAARRRLVVESQAHAAAVARGRPESPAAAPQAPAPGRPRRCRRAGCEQSAPITCGRWTSSSTRPLTGGSSSCCTSSTSSPGRRWQMECHRRIDADGRDARAARPGPWPRPAVHSLRQRARAHRERAARLVPFREDRDRLHRARLAVAEPLRRVVQLQGSRRAARRRAVQLPRRGQGPRRRLARGLQPPPAPLGARDDGPGPVRDRLEEGPAGRARCLAPLAATRLRSARQRR
jgi:hypothetical protein